MEFKMGIYSVEDMIEIKISSPEKFLVIKETLTRIGVASKKENILYQSCHILHKKGRLYLVSFKELFALDGKPTNLTENDIARRNTIANLLSEWGLVKLVDSDHSKEPICLINQIKIIPFKDKVNWKLISKYSIGKKIKNGNNSNINIS